MHTGPKVSEGMRIGTWNVQYARGREKNARRLAVLEQHACDVWVLTETHDDLKFSATHAALHSAPRPKKLHGQWVPSSGPRWVSIWSRFPIRRSLEVFDAKRTVAALLDAPSGPFIVYGTVMPWQSDRGDAPAGVLVKGWSEHNRVVQQQGEEWAHLQRLHPDADLCVAGDFNTVLGRISPGTTYRPGTAAGRLSLQGAMDCCSLFCATQTDRVPSGALKRPLIDHVLLPAAWAARTTLAAAWEGKGNGDVSLSDHSGVAIAVA